jgi:hypothetical protein
MLAVIFFHAIGETPIPAGETPIPDRPVFGFCELRGLGYLLGLQGLLRR